MYLDKASPEVERPPEGREGSLAAGGGTWLPLVSSVETFKKTVLIDMDDK